MKPRTLKFSRCPIGKHNGQYWFKLRLLNQEAPVILRSVICVWSDQVPTVEIKRDTFPDWTRKDWRDLMELFYKERNVFGMVLTFTQGEYKFTTFRAYTSSKHGYYKQSIGEEFILEVAE